MSLVPPYGFGLNVWSYKKRKQWMESRINMNKKEGVQAGGEEEPERLEADALISELVVECPCCNRGFLIEVKTTKPVVDGAYTIAGRDEYMKSKGIRRE